MIGQADTMRAMVRLLATLLIFTTLVGNTAWAVDIHFSDWNDHIAAEFSASDDSSNKIDDGPVCPDHCSHAVAHLLGLHRDNSTIYAPLHGHPEFARSHRLITRFPTPPSEPPRA